MVYRYIVYKLYTYGYLVYRLCARIYLQIYSLYTKLHYTCYIAAIDYTWCSIDCVLVYTYRNIAYTRYIYRCIFYRLCARVCSYSLQIYSLQTKLFYTCYTASIDYIRCPTNCVLVNSLQRFSLYTLYLQIHSLQTVCSDMVYRYIVYRLHTYRYLVYGLCAHIYLQTSKCIDYIPLHARYSATFREMIVTASDFWKLLPQTFGNSEIRTMYI